MQFQIECEREEDGRWLAEVVGLSFLALLGRGLG